MIKKARYWYYWYYCGLLAWVGGIFDRAGAACDRVAGALYERSNDIEVEECSEDWSTVAGPIPPGRSENNHALRADALTAIFFGDEAEERAGRELLRKLDEEEAK